MEVVVASFAADLQAMPGEPDSGSKLPIAAGSKPSTDFDSLISNFPHATFATLLLSLMP